MPPPRFHRPPGPEMLPALVVASLWLKTSVPLLTMFALARLAPPLAVPLPICKVPPLRVTVPVKELEPVRVNWSLFWATRLPLPLKALGKVRLSVRAKTSVPLSVTAPPGRLPVLPPLPICKVPAEMVVVPS